MSRVIYTTINLSLSMTKLLGVTSAMSLAIHMTNVKVPVSGVISLGMKTETVAKSLKEEDQQTEKKIERETAPNLGPDPRKAAPTK